MTKNQPQPCTQGSTAQPLTDKLISQLFTRMQSIYGHLWASRWRDENSLQAARAEWAHDLAAFDSVTISQALRKCKAKYIDHPPTLPQMIALCETYKPACAAHHEYTPIAPIRTTKEQAQQNIEKLRRAIAGAGMVV